MRQIRYNMMVEFDGQIVQTQGLTEWESQRWIWELLRRGLVQSSIFKVIQCEPYAIEIEEPIPHYLVDNIGHMTGIG